MFSTPILFLVFNRPNTTQDVFDQIKKLKPAKLFIAADGPRKNIPSDEERCKEVRSIVNEVDWQCQVVRLYRDQNLGCKLAVSQAISWFFDQVEEGIILEDDTLPNFSFFRFCENMLQQYRHEDRIMHIGGFNLLGKWKENIQSYHFSYFGSIWGWAAWRRSWKFYDADIKQWYDVEIQKRILSYFPLEYRESKKILYDKLYKGEIDTWDYQWTFCRLLNNGLSIIPSLNLVNNIGFNQSGTHTLRAPSWLSSEIYEMEVKGNIAISIKPDVVFDNIHNKLAFGNPKKKLSLFGRLNRALKKVFAGFKRNTIC